MVKLIPIAAALALLSTAALAQDKASQKFITEAIEGNFAEVNMGQLAERNGQNSEIKAYGPMLVKDHGDANQRAQEVARSLGVNAPSGPNAKQKKDYDKMAKLNGAAFDREFAKHMVKDHKKDVAAYAKAATKQGAVGEYAKTTLTALQAHLAAAQQLQKKGSVH